MMFYYRADEFDRLGLTVPTTWDEFADAARDGAAEEPEAVPDHVLLGRPGLVRRPGPAGGRHVVGRSTATRGRSSASTTPPPRRSPSSGATWSQEGAIDNQPMYTPEWNAALNDGTLLAWPSAVWAPGRARRQRRRHRRASGRWRRCRSGPPARTRPAAGAARRPPSPRGSQHDEAAARVRDLAEHRRRGDRGPGDARAASTRPSTAASRRRARRSRPTFFSNQPDFYTRGQGDRGHRAPASPSVRT